MTTLVIGSRNSGTKNDPRMMAESLRERGINATTVYWEELVFSLRTDHATIYAGDLELTNSSVDLVIAVGWYKNDKAAIYRDVAYATALVLEAQGIPFWNKEMILQRSTSKLSTMVQLALEHLPIPMTRASLSLDLATQDMTMPYVAKAAAASRGADNYLIKTVDDEMQLRSTEVKLFLLQEFLENDHDLRVICFGGSPQLILRRSRAADAGTHLNNTSQGGSAEWVDLKSVSTELLTFCEKTCTIFGRELAGIDLIPDILSPFGYSCLEVNAIPQLTSGTDIIKKMDALAEVLKQRKGEL